ncbi:hypothetical protein [Empedobacter falsenii]|uniref:Uncharacterized protein n=1 Tax=Empedobacter falsenii TaxID=343874 RepID=A0AAW7DHW6_9FLAO|nr:hypothetical protein [Empedobacter falsenii]MDM1551128.1 hypothetical protein [Empedobacter falsenii]
MKKITFLLLSVISINLFAQNSNDLLNDLSSQTNGLLYNRKSNDGKDNSKYYLDEKFKKGYVDGYSDSGNYRYNMFTDNIEFEDSKGGKYTLVKNIGTVVRLENGVVFEYVNINGINLQKFLQVLSSDNNKYKLYKSYQVKEIVNENINSYNEQNKVKYNTIINYFIGFNNSIVEIPNSPKKFTNLLGFDVGSVIKSNNISLNKEQDLIKLIDLLNK